MAVDLPDLSRKAAERLAKALTDKGARLGSAPDVVDLGFGELQAKCIVFDAQPQNPSGWGVALGVEVTGPGLEKPVRDTSGARAESLDDALEGTVQGWISGLHIPLRDALGEQAVPYRYSITQTNTTTGDVTDWSTYESPLHIGGSEKTHEKLWDLLKDPPLFGRFVQQGLLPVLGQDDLHWLRVDAIGEKGKTVQVHGSYDGTPWNGPEKLLKDFSWPGEELLMIRQYWVLIAN